MMKYEGEAKGVMLQPFKFNNNGVIFFGQWNVFSLLFRKDIHMAKD